MISVIIAVHNQLSMNRLFYESLLKSTKGEFELIVIDNNSTDGTREFFRERADQLILNDANYSYSYCQNQGIRVAKYEYLAFFNNDMILSHSWDTRTLEFLRKRKMTVISLATEPIEDVERKRAFQRKWKWIKYPMLAFWGKVYWSLKIMLSLMYRNFDRYCETRFRKFGFQSVEGFSGCSIFMHRSVLEKVGWWDERIYAADFDLFFRLKERNMNVGDIEPLQVALGIFFHHYSRLTYKGNYEPFADAGNLIDFKEKWPNRKYLMRDIGKLYT